MRPIFVTMQLAASSANNISQSQKPAAGGVQNLTLNGTTAGVLDVARQVLITSSGNDSGNTFVVYGTDASGNPISESVVGPNTTATTVNMYKTVTAITISANAVGNITVGTNGVGASKAIPLDQHVSPFAVALFLEIAAGKTVNATVQYTPDDIFDQTKLSSITWTDHATIASKTANIDSNIAFPAAAVRLKINSGTDPALLVVRQAGLWG